MSQTTAKATTFSIQELHEMVTSGEMRIPAFQRSFRWELDDVLALFDSIMKGYPFGSLLLWRKQAPSAKVQIGAITKRVGPKEAAYWVVDGQQRITSLVNCYDGDASSRDPRFRIGFDLKEEKIVSLEKVSSVALVVPLPILFDFSKAFEWLGQNPHARDYASKLQSAVKFLNEVRVPASIVQHESEEVLREVFDRINSRGKRLSASEIFHAIHGASGTAEGKQASLRAICEQVEAQTQFGLLDETVVLQSLLVRRHHDITRDFHQEFATSSAVRGGGLDEDREQAFERTTAAVLATVRFLREYADVPHYAFVPFRLQFLVLVRFFDLFPEPSKRNVELLRRWFWRVCVAARPLKITGSTREVSNFAKLVQPNEEDESIQRLLSRVESDGSSIGVAEEAVAKFRSNSSLSKVLLCAMWELGPVNPCTGERISQQELADSIGVESSPAPVVIEMLPRNTATGSRVISTLDSSEFVTCVTSSENADTLRSLGLTPELVRLMNGGEIDKFLERREVLLSELTSNFLDVRCAFDFPSNSAIQNLQLRPGLES